MNDSSGETRPSPARRAILSGLVAGIAAGYVSYHFAGIVGLVVGFIAVTIVGSRSVLLMTREGEGAE